MFLLLLFTEFVPSPKKYYILFRSPSIRFRLYLRGSRTPWGKKDKVVGIETKGSSSTTVLGFLITSMQVESVQGVSFSFLCPFVAFSIWTIASGKFLQSGHWKRHGDVGVLLPRLHHEIDPFNNQSYLTFKTFVLFFYNSSVDCQVNIYDKYIPNFVTMYKKYTLI